MYHNIFVNAWILNINLCSWAYIKANKNVNTSTGFTKILKLLKYYIEKWVLNLFIWRNTWFISKTYQDRLGPVFDQLMNFLNNI